jgi:DNA-directed RNA polymerase subunit RPC12/RpoP
MSDFKFACPGCGQHISASDDYVGRQINCPACRAAMTVPPNPSAPPAPPLVARLSVSHLGAAPPQTPVAVATPEEQGSAAFQAHMARPPKKSYSGLIAGVAVVALLGLSVFFSRGWLAAKWRAYHGASAAAIAATNQPPVAPAELTVAEIWQNTLATYQGLSSLSATGTANAVLDMAPGSAAANPAGTQTSMSADLTIKLGRPDNFRIEVKAHTGLVDISTVGWSAGNGYYRMINNKRSKETSRDAVLSGLGLAGPGAMAGLFFTTAGNLPTDAGTDWSLTDGAEIPGQPCYVLAGKILAQNIRIWVNKQTFLIHRVQIVLGGNTNAPEMDDAKIKEALTAAKNGQAVTAADIAQFKAQMKMASQIKGAITENYQNIQTNSPIALAEFEPPPSASSPAGQSPTAAPQQGGAAAQGGRASRIAAGVRRGN